MKSERGLSAGIAKAEITPSFLSFLIENEAILWKKLSVKCKYLALDRSWICHSGRSSDCMFLSGPLSRSVARRIRVNEQARSLGSSGTYRQCNINNLSLGDKTECEQPL